MTLVVARTTSNQICLVSDTQVTKPLDLVQSPLAAALKIVPLSRTTAVAFAGDLRPAAEALSRIRSAIQSLTDHDSVSEYLHGEHLRCSGNTEYLVCALGPTPRITKIADGAIARNLAAAHLGNRSAFSEFQREYLSLKDFEPFQHFPSDVRPFLEMQHRCQCAMSSVIDSKRFIDVGGFAVRLCSHAGQFRFLASARTELRGTTSSAAPVPLTLSTAAEGAYSTSILIPEDVTAPLVGIHFNEGRFGIVLEWSNGPVAHRVVDRDVDEFGAEVYGSFGVALRGVRHGGRAD